MRLVDYFAGPLFCLWSPLPPEECARRINAAAGSPFDPFGKGVTGFVWLGWVRLRDRRAPHEFGTKPLFAGRIDPLRGGTRLRLRYRAPMPAYFAAALAFPMLLLTAYLAMLASGSLGITGEGYGPILLVAAVIVALPLAMHRIGSINAQAGRDELMQFLEQQVQAHRLSD